MSRTPVELLQEYFDNWQRADDDAAAALWADDVVMHYPGRNRFSGRYEGRKAILDYLEEVHRLGGSEVVEVYSIFGSGSNVAASYREDLLWKETFSLRRFNNYRFEDGKIVEIWVYEEDQYAVDEFVARYGG